MSMVRCARHQSEQNLEVIQRECRIYYEVSRDIECGTELVVWYGHTYLQYMGVPVEMRQQQQRQGIVEEEEERRILGGK